MGEGITTEGELKSDKTLINSVRLCVEEIISPNDFIRVCLGNVSFLLLFTLLLLSNISTS